MGVDTLGRPWVCLDEVHSQRTWVGVKWRIRGDISRSWRHRFWVFSEFLQTNCVGIGAIFLHVPATLF